MPVVEGDAVQEIARYVKARRRSLTVAEAARRAGLSARKWHQIEAGEGHHRDTTLRKVAKGLGESPARLFEIGDLPYDEDDEVAAMGLESRIGALEVSLSEVRDQVSRIVEHLGLRR